MIRSKTLSAVVASFAAFAAAPVLAAPPVEADIINPSFEDPVLVDGAFALGGVPGWSDFNAFGPINPPPFVLNVPVPDGENVAFSNLANGDTAGQILNTTICDGDEITLKVWVGARADALAFAGYVVALEALADDDTITPLASVTSNDIGAIIPAPGMFIEVTVTANIDNADLTGDRIVVNLGSFRVPGQQTFFDDVRVSVQTHSIQVPDCVPTIQEALEIAEDGDEIVLQPGAYPGRIDFMGKNVTIRSIDPFNSSIVNQTRIVPFVFRGDPGPSPSLVTFNSGEGPGAGLLGVTLDNQANDAVNGACILIEGASPTIASCDIRQGHAENFGGGVYVVDGAPAFLDCEFSHHRAALGGGGMYLGDGADADVLGCRFFDCNTEFGSGGAIHIAPGAAAELSECIFSTLYAGLFGGAISIDSRESVTISDCDFGDFRSGHRFGSASATLGGLIFSLNSSPTISDSFLANGDAQEGGGMFAYGGSPTITNTLFSSNYASGNNLCCNDEADAETRGLLGTSGGGGYAQNTGEVSFEGCVFLENVARTGGGLSSVFASVSMDDCLFEANRAEDMFNDGARGTPDWGGGAYIDVGQEGSVQIHRTRFLRNMSDDHGGGLVLDQPYFNPTARGNGGEPDVTPLGAVTNCLFHLNECEGNGGGALIRGTGFVLANSTFYDNAAYDPFNPPPGSPEYGGQGGALFAEPRGQGLGFDIVNCIMWANNTPNQFHVDDFLGNATVGHSCIQDGLPGFGAIDAGGNIETFPRFLDVNGPDNDPGTPDDNDFRLAMNSPCIDAGDTPSLLSADASGLDLDGLARVLDDPGVADTGIDDGGGLTVDMGAYEFAGMSDPRCSPADLAEPFDVLNFDDVLAFLDAFGNKEVDADLDVPFGDLDFSDVFAYLKIFGDGCDE